MLTERLGNGEWRVWGNHQMFTVKHRPGAKSYAAYEVIPDGEPPMTRKFSSLKFALEFLAEL